MQSGHWDPNSNTQPPIAPGTAHTIFASAKRPLRKSGGTPTMSDELPGQGGVGNAEMPTPVGPAPIPKNPPSPLPREEQEHRSPSIAYPQGREEAVESETAILAAVAAQNASVGVAGGTEKNTRQDRNGQFSTDGDVEMGLVDEVMVRGVDGEAEITFVPSEEERRRAKAMTKYRQSVQKLSSIRIPRKPLMSAGHATSSEGVVGRIEAEKLEPALVGSTPRLERGMPRNVERIDVKMEAIETPLLHRSTMLQSTSNARPSQMLQPTPYTRPSDMQRNMFFSSFNEPPKKLNVQRLSTNYNWAVLPQRRADFKAWVVLGDDPRPDLVLLKRLYEQDRSAAMEVWSNFFRAERRFAIPWTIRTSRTFTREGREAYYVDRMESMLQSDAPVSMNNLPLLDDPVTDRQWNKFSHRPGIFQETWTRQERGYWVPHDCEETKYFRWDEMEGVFPSTSSTPWLKKYEKPAGLPVPMPLCIWYYHSEMAKSAAESPRLRKLRYIAEVEYAVLFLSAWVIEACLAHRAFVLRPETIDELDNVLGSRNFVRNMDTKHAIALMRSALLVDSSRYCSFYFVRTFREYERMHRTGGPGPLPDSVFLVSKAGSGVVDMVAPLQPAFQTLWCRRVNQPIRNVRRSETDWRSPLDAVLVECDYNRIPRLRDLVRRRYWDQDRDFSVGDLIRNLLQLLGESPHSAPTDGRDYAGPYRDISEVVTDGYGPVRRDHTQSYRGSPSGAGRHVPMMQNSGYAGTREPQAPDCTRGIDDDYHRNQYERPSEAFAPIPTPSTPLSHVQNLDPKPTAPIPPSARGDPPVSTATLRDAIVTSDAILHADVSDGPSTPKAATGKPETTVPISTPPRKRPCMAQAVNRQAGMNKTSRRGAFQPTSLARTSSASADEVVSRQAGLENNTDC